MTRPGRFTSRMRVRLLPVVIVGISALLFVRLGELSFGVDLTATAPAMAAEDAGKDAAKDAGKDSAHTEAKSEKVKAADPASAGGDAHGEPEADRRSTDFPVEFTPGEVAVLQDLAARRDALTALEKDLEARERLLGVAEDRLDSRIAELKTLRDSIESLVRQYNEQEQSELQSIVKIYETMKPKDAASILGGLEMRILLGIMESMKERKSASILAAMEPQKAREITAELARKREIDLTTPAKKDGPAG